jgi:hypothetical protein
MSILKTFLSSGVKVIDAKSNGSHYIQANAALNWRGEPFKWHITQAVNMAHITGA